MTTLTDGTTTTTISDDLMWADEFAWAPVEQTVERSITGALIVSAAHGCEPALSITERLDRALLKPARLPRRGNPRSLREALARPPIRAPMVVTIPVR